VKNRLSVCFAAITLATGLAIPIQLAAQNKAQEKTTIHHHYKLIDLGTFGGPQSYVTSPDLTLEADVNNHGVLAGWADTSKHDAFPGFCFNDDCRVSHAFQWRHGVKTNLGALKDGVSSASSWISANDLIAGVSENGEVDPLISGFPELRAVLWRNGRISNLGTLPEGGHESFANAVNSRGQVIGAGLNDIPDPDSMVGLGYETRAFFWENGVMQDLGTLPGGTDAQALLVNERGEVMGWSYTSSDASAVCASLVGLSLTTGSFLWDKEHGMVNLGSFGGTCTLASGLNNRGQVAGGSYLPGDQSSRAFVWDRATGIRDLPTLGGDNAGAFAINDAGEAVGGSWLAGNVQIDAALWGKGGVTDLGVVNDDCGSYAFGINASGAVVGNSFVCSSDATRGFLWEDGGPMVDLNTLVVPSSSLYVPLAITINDRGEIAAPGLLPNGDQHAVLLIPCDENHPGIKGCDYSLIEGSSTVAADTVPIAEGPTTPNTRIPGRVNPMMRSFGRRSMPWYRNHEVQPPSK
jgi:probable HAF family extracellular repeat protein